MTDFTLNFAGLTIPLVTLGPDASTALAAAARAEAAEAGAVGAGATALQKTANLSDLTSTATARTNLGLGSAAVADTGTSGAAVPLLNGTNSWSSPQTFSGQITGSGGLVIGAEQGGFVPASHLVQIVATGAVTPLMITGGSGAIEIWKDSTPTKANSIGCAVPGTGITDDLVFARYTGGSYSETFRIANATKNATFQGSVTAANLSGTNTGDQTTITGNAGTATALQTARTIGMTGDVTWTSPSFNGSANVTAAGTIAAGVVTNAKLANVATATFKGRTTAGTGSPEDLTTAQATALLDTFTSALKGLAPASGGGTTNFLRADGTWAAPAGGGGGTTTNALTINNGGAGVASGGTFNGSAAITISYNSIGAARAGAITAGDLTIATARLAGRTTAATGAVEEISVGANLSLSAGVLNTGATVALLASPSFTGTPSAPTAAPGTKTTQIATTAFVKTPGIQAVTSSATVTPTFSDDQVNITAQAAALSLANPTGTAQDGYGIAIRIKDNGTARAITYGTQYRAIGVTLPSTTVASKTLYLGMIYNAADTKWDVVSVAQEA